MRCEDLAPVVAASVDDPTALDADQRAHLATCLRCQAEVARERRLHRSLGSLRELRLVPPADLLDQIYDRLDEVVVRAHHRGRRVALVGGLAAATTAAAAGAIVLAARGRRPRLPIAG